MTRDPIRPRQPTNVRRWLTVPLVLLVLALAYRQGRFPSMPLLLLMVMAGGGLLLLQHPSLGPFALVLAALAVPMQFGTGTEVSLNPATLLIPASLGLWAIGRLPRRGLYVPASRTMRPLLLFLLSGLLSLGLGYVFWDPRVPRPGNFLFVSLGQWAIFAIAGGAFVLTALLGTDERALRTLVLFYLAIAGGLSLLRVLPGTSSLLAWFSTGAVDRAPFWMLLTAVAGGQLLYNRGLGIGWRLLLLASLGAVAYYAFRLQRETLSNWVGVAAVAGALAWLRFRCVRPMVILAVAILLVTGVLYQALFTFAGGEAEWELSGGSRLALISRVIQLTMRNPITGLGPAAYRPYGLTDSLQYRGAFYQSIALSSHNNYVDLFSHGGLLGLLLFLWFAWEVARLGGALRKRFTDGFFAGYVNGALAAGAGALVIMAMADWVLPFVYNIGFHGFQASVLVWLLLGGLVTIEQMSKEQALGG